MLKMIINIELGEFPLKRPVIPAEETVSQFAKYVIPDIPARVPLRGTWPG